MKVYSLGDIDDRERVILMSIFEFQLEEPKGISWGKLLEHELVRKEMSKQTFSRRIKGLIERGLLEKEVLKNKKGKPTLYRLDPKLFAELKEFRERIYPWGIKSEIHSFEKDAESFDTRHLVDAMMELAFGLLNTLAIALTCFETEGARWLFYDVTYQNIRQLLGDILNRASKSKEDKELTLVKLFELLEPFADRPIGKRFGLDELCKSRQIIIREIMDQ